MKRSVEHRWNVRRPVETEVILHSPRLGVVRAKTCNVSYGGMCVDTRPLTLSPNTQVRATFVVRHDVADAYRSVDMRVIYLNRHGCGLMLTDFDRDIFTVLHALMLADTGPRSRSKNLCAHTRSERPGPSILAGGR